MRISLTNFTEEDIKVIKDIFPGIKIVDQKPFACHLDKQYLEQETDATKLTINILKILAPYYFQEYVEDPNDSLEL